MLNVQPRRRRVVDSVSDVLELSKDAPCPGPRRAETLAARPWPCRVCRRPAADFAGHEVDQLAGLDLAHGIGRDAGCELNLVAVHGGQHDGGGLELVLELVQRLAQGLGVGAFSLAASTLRPLTSTVWATTSSPWLEASLRLVAASSFPAALTWSSTAQTRQFAAGAALRVFVCTAAPAIADLGQRVVARDSLDAAHAGRHAAFGHDLEQADVAGR